MANETAHKALDVLLDAIAVPFRAAADFVDQTKPGLGFGVPSLKAVRFKIDPENAAEWTGIQLAILGEFGNTKRYLVLNVSTGAILAGTYPIDRFEAIPEAEL